MSESFVWQAINGRQMPSKGIMGIVNITPDSFFDGGKHETDAIAHGRKLLEDGAVILDLGAESTRPGAIAVKPEAEWLRLKPALAGLRSTCKGALISIDTRNASTARKALEAGADIINDVSGIGDHEMPAILGQYRPGYVLMHTQGCPRTMQQAPHYDDVVAEILSFFESSLNILTAHGLPEENIAIDPGIGFGKTMEHNFRILRHIRQFMILGRPILLGLSMKSLFGDLLGLPLQDRTGATMTATALLAAKGVHWHRVHDARSAKIALALATALE